MYRYPAGGALSSHAQLIVQPRVHKPKVYVLLAAVHSVNSVSSQYASATGVLKKIKGCILGCSYGRVLSPVIAAS